ncbi:hypothetical protein C1Y10_29530, partial [Pseudomonas sp. FW305-122]
MADVPSARCEHQAPLSRADHEVATALRLVEFNWRLLASVAGFVLAWLVATQFYIEPAGYVVAFALATLCGWFGLRNA